MFIIFVFFFFYCKHDVKGPWKTKHTKIQNKKKNDLFIFPPGFLQSVVVLGEVVVDLLQFFVKGPLEDLHFVDKFRLGRHYG